MFRHRAMSITAALVAAAACSAPVPPRACTEIGCDSGITLEFTGTLPESFTVTARVDGQVVATVQCNAQRACPQAFLAGVTAPRVEIHVTGTGLDVRREVTPSYVTTQPNGPGCPPTCTQARVRIDVTG